MLKDRMNNLMSLQQKYYHQTIIIIMFMYSTAIFEAQKSAYSIKHLKGQYVGILGEKSQQ